MTPITEDQVVCLMKGIKAREKKAPKRITRTVHHQDSGGRMTARVLDYTASEASNGTSRGSEAPPIILDEARAARKARCAVQGFFFYSLYAGQNSA